ncbi:MAG: Stp1/IreP family PP2C-type Ser/Thr phosphatase [Actinobacteria bacterium]|nr:Stp1/IreP family PP2C-type Ser/Thr phosphatase [Actinomycetota bacterium]
MYHCISASMTHTGKVREMNEDAVLESGNLSAVADGMGGHQAGEVASSLALSVVRQYVEDNLGLIGGDELVKRAVEAANAAVHEKAVSSAKYHDMGTTLTMMYREGDTVYFGHVGDSRAYIFRGGRLMRLTRDHSFVARLVAEGEITEEEARVHPQRNIILFALGLNPKVDVDLMAVKVMPGDEFLLVTDGLYSMVEDRQIEQVLAGETEPAAAVKRLVDLALEAGGADNVSVVLTSYAKPFAAAPTGVTRETVSREALPAEGIAEAKPRSRIKAHAGLLIVFLVLLLCLGLVFGIGFYFYNRTYFVGVKGGKVTLFHGLPFWKLAKVERETDIEVKFLPEERRRRVEDKLDPESREDAEATIKSLASEAEQNSSIVPAVEGKSLAEAQAMMEQAGLETEPDVVSPPDPAQYVVLVQEPEAGTRVEKGSAVKLKVAAAAAPAQGV